MNGGSPQRTDDGNEGWIDDRYKTSSNELQHVPPLDFGKSDKCVAVEWLLGKCNCTHINHLDLILLFETTAEWWPWSTRNTNFPTPLDYLSTQAWKNVLWGSIRRKSAIVVAQINNPAARGRQSVQPIPPHALSRDLRDPQMSSDALSPGWTSLPEREYWHECWWSRGRFG